MSFSTVFLFVLGVAMLALGLGINLVAGDEVPILVCLLAAGFGAYLIGTSYFSLRLDERRARARESSTPVTAACEFERVFDGDTVSYMARLTVRGEAWQVPVGGSRKVRHLIKEGRQSCQVWLDEEGRVVSLAHDGAELRVLPFPRKANDA